MQPIMSFTIPDITNQKTLEEEYRYLQEPVKLALSLLEKSGTEFAPEAVQILTKLSNGDGPAAAQACKLLGLIYIRGIGPVQQDVQKAVSFLEKCDNWQTNYYLGAIFFNGMGNVEADRKKAIFFLDKASQQDNALASTLLGAIYWAGAEGEVKDQEKAQKYFEGARKRASLGELSRLSQAVNSIVADYAIENDPQYAHCFIRSAEEAKQADLSRRLGNKLWKIEYQQGNAISYWTLMAETIPAERSLSVEEQDALTDLGHATYDRATVQIDYKCSNSPQMYAQAASYWKRASDAGCPRAHYYLGLAHYSGKGVQQNPEAGKDLLTKASDLQFLPAKIMLQRLEGKEKRDVTVDIAKQDHLKLPPNEERDCLQAKKNFLGKAWTWFKKHAIEIILTTIGAVALAAIVGGLIALTIFFPHVMVPIFIVVGAVGGGGIVLFGLLLAAVSGSHGAQRILQVPLHG